LGEQGSRGAGEQGSRGAGERGVYLRPGELVFALRGNVSNNLFHKLGRLKVVENSQVSKAIDICGI
jgi:hypothetical protein